MAALHKIIKYGYPLGFILSWPVPAYAAADSADKYRWFVSENVQYDSNVFYLSSDSTALSLRPGSSKADIRNQLAAGITVNYPVGRQKLLANLAVSDNRYVNNQFLDNISTDDRIAWSWELGRQLSGDLGYNYKHFLDTTAYAYIQEPIKNITSASNVFGKANYALHPRWKISLGANWSENTNSNKARKIYDNQVATGRIGFSYLTPSGNSTGMEYAYTNVDYINRTLDPVAEFDSRYSINTVNALLDWKYSVKTRLEGAFGYTILRNGHFSERDFNGETWRINLTWAATASTQLTLAGWRDLWPSQTAYGNYVVTEGVGLLPSWSPTEKLTVKGNISYQTNDYAGVPKRVVTQISSPNSRKDTQYIAQITSSYSPRRNIELNLSFMANKRDSTIPSASYLDFTVFASAMISF